MFKLKIWVSSKKTSLLLLIFIAISFLIDPVKQFTLNHYFDLDIQPMFSDLVKLFVISFKIISALFALVYLFKDELTDNREKVIYKIISFWIIQCLLYYHMFDLFVFDTSKFIYFIISVMFVHLIILLLISWRANEELALDKNKLSYTVAFTKKDVLSIIVSIILIYFISIIVCDLDGVSIYGIIYHFVLSSLTAIFPMIINNKLILLIKYMYDNIDI